METDPDTGTPELAIEEAPFIRPYAAAVQRVADARRIPVADLYSALLGIPDSPFADDYGFELTVDAEALAAQLVARAMLSDSSQPKRRIRDLIRW